MSEDDVPLGEVSLPTRHDIHTSDVLMQFSEKAGASWFSVVEAKPGQGMILVQDQEGDQSWRLPSSFAVRYSLKDAGRFKLTWRVSPISAIEAHNAKVK